VAGKRLQLFAQRGKITQVAWHTQQAVYWISNTLSTDISNRQMVSIAASLTRAAAERRSAAPGCLRGRGGRGQRGAVRLYKDLAGVPSAF